VTRGLQPEGQMFGERLRELRKRRTLTQEELATRADLAGPYISDMERGLKVPSLTTVLQLAMALECKVTELVGLFDKTDLRELLGK
jgi:transcriptional regulator with XRE-family HTH domain